MGQEPIGALLRSDGTLRKIPHIGPSSSRIILEVLHTGSSPTVERTILESGRMCDVERRRELRCHFLTRHRVVAALDTCVEGSVGLDDYQGDLRMHSVWSDGTQTLEEIISGGLARGYSFCAVTDHSYGLPIAGGVSMAALERQHLEIDRLNRLHAGTFRLLKGIEANIRADGSVDMASAELRKLEIVVAAPHSALRSTTDQTSRMITAVMTPGVNILGHPRGRLYGSRPGVAADWSIVFEAAACSGVAIEIDGDPARQDIDYDLARIGVRAGCVFALDSDAHAVDELHYAETAIAHTRLAGIPAERVINCWSVDKLLGWARAPWNGSRV